MASADVTTVRVIARDTPRQSAPNRNLENGDQETATPKPKLLTMPFQTSKRKSTPDCICDQ